ncbi:DUF2397 domain-containing protein [Streptomyces sp. NPDC093228]|uniref:DUF2397 domain-containing protein n=1 Tax=Streptomyces sp. NPDC093228 TaxID=3155070 RepID=UPI0034492929
MLRSTHTVRAGSIAEYQRSRSRYQLSKLGERVQRDADEVLAGADAAREVSSELLTLVERGLGEIAAMVAVPGGADPQQALEKISTLFVQFTEFAESVRDFYAYLGQVLARYDLDTAEYQGFKELLLDYVEAITEEVSFRAPRIALHLQTIWPHLPTLLACIDANAAGLAALSDTLADTRVQRSRGRDLADWEGLRDWFTDSGGQGSQVDQLRDATLRALQSLLANAKRLLRSAAGDTSRRKDLLRLAAWFDGAQPEEAHDIAVAAFGLYGARHLGVAPDPDVSVPAYVSWWTGPAVDVPVALRERGSRAPRGPAGAVEDHGAQKRHLLEQARQQAAELRSASGRFDQVRLTSAAMRLLLELLRSPRSPASVPPPRRIRVSFARFTSTSVGTPSASTKRWSSQYAGAPSALVATPISRATSTSLSGRPSASEPKSSILGWRARSSWNSASVSNAAGSRACSSAPRTNTG